MEPVGTQVKLGLQLRISQSVVVDAGRHGYVCECTDYFVANGFLCLSFAALAFFSVNTPMFFSAEGPVDLRCAREIFLFFCMRFPVALCRPQLFLERMSLLTICFGFLAVIGLLLGLFRFVLLVRLRGLTTQQKTSELSPGWLRAVQLRRARAEAGCDKKREEGDLKEHDGKMENSYR
jgi:hypothetical protein